MQQCIPKDRGVFKWLFHDALINYSVRIAVIYATKAVAKIKLGKPARNRRGHGFESRSSLNFFQA